MGGHHAPKNKPREDLTDEQFVELCVIAVRQHRDDLRLWVRRLSLDGRHDSAAAQCPSASSCALLRGAGLSLSKQATGDIHTSFLAVES